MAARRDLLLKARQDVQEKLNQYQATLEKLNYKIARYDALKAGVLSWNDDCDLTKK